MHLLLCQRVHAAYPAALQGPGHTQRAKLELAQDCAALAQAVGLHSNTGLSAVVAGVLYQNGLPQTATLPCIVQVAGDSRLQLWLPGDMRCVYARKAYLEVLAAA